jgi:hypothetical protein
MAEFRIEATLLVNTLIAVGLALLISHVSFGLPSTIAGAILLLILYTYDQGTRRTAGQSLAFAAVAALPFTLAIAIGIQRLADRSDLETWFVLTWLCATVVGMAIDRARMSARTAQPVLAPPGSAPSAPGSIPSVPEVAPQPSWSPAPARKAAAPKYGLGLSGPAEAQSSQVPPGVIHRPETPAPNPALTEQRPVSPPEPAPTAVSEPPRMAPPPPPSPQARKAEEATIYIDIIDQGISLLRSVRAEHIARDIYRIVESMPEGEIWHYKPGQTVRCRKQKLSVGKALVAFEEVILQRAN